MTQLATITAADLLRPLATLRDVDRRAGTSPCGGAVANCPGTCALACAAKAQAKAPTRSPISCLQIGTSWFSEKSGGLERYYRDLLNHLPAVGVTPAGLVAGTGRVATESGGSVRSFAQADLPILKRLRAVRRETAVQMKAGEVDVVASHFALYGLPAIAATRGTPWVVHFHGPWAAEARAEGAGRIAAKLKYAVERRVYRRAARFVTLSKAFGRILTEQYGVPEEKVSVVPGGVDAAKFTVSESRSEARAILGWPTDQPVILAVRRLVPRMGLENLIDAAAHPALRDARIMIIGKGPLDAALRQRVVDVGATGQVRFLGHLPDGQLPLAYRAADLTVVPSVSLEGFGLTTVESMMAGTPALVTPVGGLPEVVGDLSPDLITEGTSTEQLIEGLRRSLFGVAGVPDADVCRDYAMSRFDWRVIAGRVRNVYEQAIAGA